MSEPGASGPHLAPWLQPAAVDALIAALARALPGRTRLRLCGAAAPAWADRLGAAGGTAETVDEVVATAPPGAAGRAEVLVLCSPDALPADPDAEAAFVAAAAAHADAVLLATVNPAGAVDRPGRWPAYWAARFAVHGRRPADAVRAAIWDDSHLHPDVKEGALLFVADGVEVVELPAPLGVLHPHRSNELLRLFEARLDRFRDEVAEATRGGAVGELETQRLLLRGVEARVAALDRRVGHLADRPAASSAGGDVARALVGRIAGRPAGAGRGGSVDPAVAALFDPYYYVEHNPEAVDAPLEHYLRHGEAEGRRPNAYFDPAFYLRTNPDVAAAGMSALGHYAHFGGAEGRAASTEFDTAWYVSRHPEVIVSGLHPLVHFLAVGEAQGYPGTPTGRPVPITGPVFAPQLVVPAGPAAPEVPIVSPSPAEPAPAAVPAVGNRPLSGTYIGNGRVLVYLQTGGRLLLSSDDLTLVGELLQDGIYDVPFTRFLQRTLTPASTFVDVGANVGLFSITAGYLAWEGRTVAYEAAPRVAALLRENVALNWFADRVTVRPVAVGAAAGQATFRFPTTLHMLGGLALDPAAFAEQYPAAVLEAVPVEVVTLDEDLAALGVDGPIDLIKVDVEGSEADVLRGLHGLLTAGRVRRVSLEVRREIHERNRTAWDDMVAELRVLAGIGGQFGEPDAEGLLRPLTLDEVLDRGLFANLVVTFPV